MKWLIILFLLPFVLLTGGLVLNRPPLFSPPGPWSRLQAYLSSNVAETRADHLFPELRTPFFPSGADKTRLAVLAAMHRLGWEEVREDDDAGLRAVVVSALFRFRDDVQVRLESRPGGTLVHASSASRVGKGDLAANSRHLLDLFDEVALILAGPGLWPGG